MVMTTAKTASVAPSEGVGRTRMATTMTMGMMIMAAAMKKKIPSTPLQPPQLQGRRRRGPTPKQL
jgi:hypothetical protein